MIDFRQPELKLLMLRRRYQRWLVVLAAALSLFVFAGLVSGVTGIAAYMKAMDSPAEDMLLAAEKELEKELSHHAEHRAQLKAVAQKKNPQLGILLSLADQAGENEVQLQEVVFHDQGFTAAGTAGTSKDVLKFSAALQNRIKGMTIHERQKAGGPEGRISFAIEGRTNFRRQS